MALRPIAHTEHQLQHPRVALEQRHLLLVRRRQLRHQVGQLSPQRVDAIGQLQRLQVVAQRVHLATQRDALVLQVTPPSKTHQQIQVVAVELARLPHVVVAQVAQLTRQKLHDVVRLQMLLLDSADTTVPTA